jgi:nitroimidazol reductase NimA-like FMN-containing flavoprotein (pyridoxamine 5'-phosphate oxidase superfamily)
LSDKKHDSDPTASRPNIPGYGIMDSTSGKGLLPWSWATERLSKAHTYFIATTRPDGRPHLMPVWGIWLSGVFYFSTGRNSRKARNLSDNARCVVSIELSGEAVILEGVAEETTEKTVLQLCSEAYSAKYHWEMEANDEPFFAVRPSVVFGFIENDSLFTSTATRWTFDEDDA